MEQGDILGMCSLFGQNLAALITSQFAVALLLKHLQSSNKK
jgi:hypothetical protein